jgi:hypothetical protein
MEHAEKTLRALLSDKLILNRETKETEDRARRIRYQQENLSSDDEEEEEEEEQEDKQTEEQHQREQLQELFKQIEKVRQQVRKSRELEVLPPEAVCLFCCDSEMTVTFLPCNHKCCCFTCSLKLETCKTMNRTGMLTIIHFRSFVQSSN